MSAYRQNVAPGVIISSGNTGSSGRFALSPLLASVLSVLGVLDIFGFLGILDIFDIFGFLGILDIFDIFGFLGVLDILGFRRVLLLLGRSPSLLLRTSLNIFFSGVSRGRCAFLLHLDRCRSRSSFVACSP